METLNDTFQLAQERAQTLGLPYKGALTPLEAHRALGLASNCKLVDVRTRAEWDWVGRIPGAVEIEWNQYPGNIRNPNFLEELKQQISPNTTILFICRSGIRSDAAARLATEAGYTDCFNIMEGFEGDKDSNSHRNTIGGWRKSGLPWMQS